MTSIRAEVPMAETPATPESRPRIVLINDEPTHDLAQPAAVREVLLRG